MSRLGIVKASFASALTAPSVATKEHTRGMSLALQALWKSALSKYTYGDSGLPSRELVCVAYVRGCTSCPPVIIEISPSGNKMICNYFEHIRYPAHVFLMNFWGSTYSVCERTKTLPSSCLIQDLLTVYEASPLGDPVPSLLA